MQTHEIKRPWYREPWVWLLIALPMTAVVGGMITIYIAVTTSDGLVEDDYYKRGMAINRDLARDRAAADHRLQAHLDVDLNYRRVTLSLQSQGYDLPDMVSLAFLHPTQAGHDQTLELQKVDVDRYSGTVSGLMHGNWHVQLSADDWRLSGTLQLPQAKTVVVMPAYTPGP
ncbi:MAG: FixH family protein [Pseudomonadota bacterium]